MSIMPPPGQSVPIPTCTAKARGRQGCDFQPSDRDLCITSNSLWVTLLILCMKLVQTPGKRGDGPCNGCGQLVDRERQIMRTAGGQVGIRDRPCGDAILPEPKTAGDTDAK